jgi:hypothetical protein
VYLSDVLKGRLSKGSATRPCRRFDDPHRNHIVHLSCDCHTKEKSMQKISRRCGTVGNGAIGSRQRSVLMWSRLCKVGPTTKTRGPRCCVVECFFRVESVDSAGPSLDCFAQKATDNPGQLKSIVMFWPALQRLSILQWSALWHFFRPCISDVRLKTRGCSLPNRVYGF